MGTLTGRCTLRRVALNAGGYDSTGRYWGRGAPLYRAEDEAGNTWETRAQGRNYAAGMFVDHFGPNATLARYPHGMLPNTSANPCVGGLCRGCGVLHG